MTARLKCLVVGAGSSGIAAAKEALVAGIEPTVYEAREGPGGAWRFDRDPGECTVQFDEQGWATMSNRGESDFAGRSPPSPMYDALRTNVPTSIMQYRGTPFSSDVGLFCRHDQVQRYLEDCARPVQSHVRYNHRVNRIRYTTPSDGGEQRRWYAETASTTDPANAQREQFDFVMIANGHYSKPFVPWVDGLKSWTGELTHARWYRNPEVFRSKTVLVVGNLASGYDITRELAMVIHERKMNGDDPNRIPKIYQSARSPSALGIDFGAPDAPDWAREVTVFPPIRTIAGRTILFEDDRSLQDVDTIIYATGYYFSFPFLRSTDAPWAEHPVTRPPPTPTIDTESRHDLGPSAPTTAPGDGGLRLHNLDDRFLFYLPDPTAAFLCLPYFVIPFPLAQVQARLATLHFANSPQLPEPLSFVPGVAEDEPESRISVVFGHPRQFDMMDRMMIESGDSDAGTGSARQGSEYGKTSQADRDLRVGAKALRRAVLGY